MKNGSRFCEKVTRNGSPNFETDMHSANLKLLIRTLKLYYRLDVTSTLKLCITKKH